MNQQDVETAAVCPRCAEPVTLDAAACGNCFAPGPFGQNAGLKEVGDFEQNAGLKEVGGRRLPTQVTPIQSWLWLAVLSTFLFPPFGIVAVAYATQVQTQSSLGNKSLAAGLSEKSFFWGVLSIIVTVVGVFIFVLIANG